MIFVIGVTPLLLIVAEISMWVFVLNNPYIFLSCNGSHKSCVLVALGQDVGHQILDPKQREVSGRTVGSVEIWKKVLGINVLKKTL